MDCEAPASTAGSNVIVAFVDGEGDGMILKSLSEDQTRDACANDKDVGVWRRMGMDGGLRG